MNLLIASVSLFTFIINLQQLNRFRFSEGHVVECLTLVVSFSNSAYNLMNLLQGFVYGTSARFDPTNLVLVFVCFLVSAALLDKEKHFGA